MWSECHSGYIITIFSACKSWCSNIDLDLKPLFNSQLPLSLRHPEHFLNVHEFCLTEQVFHYVIVLATINSRQSYWQLCFFHNKFKWSYPIHTKYLLPHKVKKMLVHTIFGAQVKAHRLERLNIWHLETVIMVFSIHGKMTSLLFDNNPTKVCGSKNIPMNKSFIW